MAVARRTSCRFAQKLFGVAPEAYEAKVTLGPCVSDCEVSAIEAARMMRHSPSGPCHPNGIAMVAILGDLAAVGEAKLVQDAK